MPIDPRRIAERNEFNRDFMESELSPTQAKKTGKTDKSEKSRRAQGGGQSGDNVTVEYSDSQNGGSGQSQQTQLEPPTVDPTVMMMLVQSLSQKTNANKENAI